MFFRHHSDKFIFPLIGLILLFAFSYRPKYHLRSQMPAGFYKASTSSSKLAVESETRIAWAYWESAQMNVQWKYPRNSTLPVDPPAEFRVDAKALGPGASDPIVRELYWHRLQTIWQTPEAWQEDYGWDFGWLSDPLGSIGQWLRDVERRGPSFER